MENKNFKMEYSIRYINGDMVRYPHILYKYRDWSKDFHKNILINNTLYFASPKDFEDIHDCNLPEHFPSKSELYQYFINKAKVLQRKALKHVKEHIGISFKLYVYFRHFIRKHPYPGPYPYDFTISAFTPVTSA